MGHASSIALGMALGSNNGSAADCCDAVCIDGDGALLMHMGSMSTIGNSELKNYKHILINNACHDSVGGQPTNAYKTDFVSIANACGYKKSMSLSGSEEIADAIKSLHEEEGPIFIEIMTNSGAAKNLSRPKSPPEQNKHDFMVFVDKVKTKTK
eukprot:UN01131